MDPLLALWHLLNFTAPALCLAALLSLAMWLQAPARGFDHFKRNFGWLSAGGMVVLVAGLALFGRDGKMATYAALVLVVGSLAHWRTRR